VVCEQRLALAGRGTLSTRRLFHRIAKFLVLIAAVQILGGHWAVLQSVAWVKMFVEYAQEDSLRTALVKTFDGEHPCSICHTVSDGWKKEEKREATVLVEKIDAVLAPAVQLPRAEVVAGSYALAGISAVSRADAPPTPPPLA
jgi:hypothetical protein